MKCIYWILKQRKMSKLINLLIMSVLSFSVSGQSEFCSDSINKNYFNNDNYSEKLNILKEEFIDEARINGECMKLMIFEMTEYTGIDSSMSFGFEGPFYKTKELFLEDIQKWHEYIESKN